MLNENVKPIHYRAGGKLTHCGVECLPSGKDIERIVIDHIDFKDTETINGRIESNVWIAVFEKNPYTDLPMLLNSTNRKRISKLFPECNGYINMLQHVAVRLTKEETRDVQDGGTTYGLRISKIPASVAPAKKAVTAEMVEKIVAWAKKNGKTLDDIKSNYELSKEIEEKIIKAL